MNDIKLSMKIKLSLASFILCYCIHSHAVIPPVQVYVFSSYGNVTSEFAELGNMWQVGKIIWGGLQGPEIMTTLQDAESICYRLRGKSRLPKSLDTMAFAAALGKGNIGYKPTLIPGFEGKFWVDSIYLDQNTGLIFDVDSGEFQIVNRKELNLVRCVTDV